MPQPLALKDPASGASTQMGAGVATLTIVPQSFGEVMAFAEKMAESRFVPAHLRGKAADCLVVCLQALRWGFDPFSVAQKTYFIKDGSPPAYEAQLVNAVVLARAPLRSRPKITWAGTWPNRTCTVSGLFSGDDEAKIRTVHAANIKTRNSPLWVTDPDQQLAYYATRAWARLYCPDVLMGVYAPDDEDMRAENARDITPMAEEATPRPASKLDAMEEAIAGETARDVTHAPTFDQDFGFPADAGELGPREPQLGVLQPAADHVPDPAYDFANQQASKYLAKILAATDPAAITASLMKNKATIEAWPIDIATTVYEEAAKRKSVLLGGN